MDPRTGEPFNPYRRFRGAVIPNAILRNPDMSPGEKIVLGRLMQYAGKHAKAFPRVEVLGKEVGLGVRQTRRCVEALEKAAVIRRSQSKGWHYSNDFQFIWGPLWSDSTTDKGRSDMTALSTENPVTDDPEDGHLRPQRAVRDDRVGRSDMTAIRDSVKRITEKNQGNSDLDCAPKNRKRRDSSTHPSLRQSTPKPYPYLKQALRLYFQEPGQEDLDPSDRLVVKVMDAAKAEDYAVTETDIIRCLKHLHDDRGLRPGTKQGPRHWAWFPVVVAEYFRQKRDRESAATPSAAEWKERTEHPTIAKLAAELPDDGLEDFDELPF